ncbi:LysR family transcriptional regulator, partial [Pseudomonas syringae]
EFDYQDVRIEPVVVVMAENHPLAKRKQVVIEDLAETPFILFEAGFALNTMIKLACDRKGVTPKVTARSGQVDFIVDLVSAGLGVAFLPRMLAQKHYHDGIRLVALNEPDTDWHMVLAWRKNAHLSPAAEAWLALARETRLPTTS